MRQPPFSCPANPVCSHVLDRHNLVARMIDDLDRDADD
jgi:hypothetical protein